MEAVFWVHMEAVFWVHVYHLQTEQAESHQKSENSKNDEVEMDDLHCCMW